MSTPVEIWAPAFAKVVKEPLTADAIFSTAEDRHFPGQRWCRLCETTVRVGKELDRHAKQHQRDLNAWRKRGRRETEKAATARLREVNREKALAKKVLDRAPGDGAGGASSPGGRHEPTTTKKEAPRMAANKKGTGRIKPLSDAKEKKVVGDVEKAFANKSADFKKGAVVYARKLMKFADGLRSSRPPVPPALQDDDREKTRATCVAVAKAIGLDPVKVGLEKAATPADDLADAAGEKVEEEKKTTGKTAAAKNSTKTKNGKAKPAAAAAATK